MAFRVAAAAASVLALSTLVLGGCSLQRDLPRALTDAQLEAAVRAQLDRQWRLSDLQGVVVRPAFEPRPIVTEREWGRLMTECMDRAGIPQWGYDDGTGLFVEGGTPSASDQLAFYWCFAEYPTVDLLTRDQLDFVYDYYARWLIPCLETRGFNVQNAPTREAFATAHPPMGRWNPYRALEDLPSDPHALRQLQRDCPPTLLGIPGWSEFAYR
ncbi:hypothetical protein [Conyzicola sp.]|uniref:hypothetical protein n=1 Tax=Conyzicola sp. TaxID=1969404 RepID=UPI003989A451